MKRLAILGLMFASALSQAAPLYSNGPVVAGDGLSVMAPGATVYGYGMQTASNQAVADNFSIAFGQSWNVASIDFYGYQTSSTGFTFSSAAWSIISGDVNTGTVAASGVSAVSNGGLLGYRVLPSQPGSTSRSIYDVHADVDDFVLGAGQYWLRWSLTGSLASGPWQAPTSDGVAGNAAQSVGGTPFSTLSSGVQGVELPFALNGNVVASAVPEPATYSTMLMGLGIMGALALRRRRH